MRYKNNIRYTRLDYVTVENKVRRIYYIIMAYVIFHCNTRSVTEWVTPYNTRHDSRLEVNKDVFMFCIPRSLVFG